MGGLLKAAGGALFGGGGEDQQQSGGLLGLLAQLDTANQGLNQALGVQQRDAQGNPIPLFGAQRFQQQVNQFRQLPQQFRGLLPPQQPPLQQPQLSNLQGPQGFQFTPQ